jgi:hypothetical protein
MVSNTIPAVLSFALRSLEKIKLQPRKIRKKKKMVSGVLNFLI